MLKFPLSTNCVIFFHSVDLLIWTWSLIEKNVNNYVSKEFPLRDASYQISNVCTILVTLNIK